MRNIPQKDVQKLKKKHFMFQNFSLEIAPVMR